MVASAGAFSLRSTEQVVWMGPGVVIECMPVCSDVGGSGSMVRCGGGGGPQQSGFTEPELVGRYDAHDGREERFATPRRVSVCSCKKLKVPRNRLGVLVACFYLAGR